MMRITVKTTNERARGTVVVVVEVLVVETQSIVTGKNEEYHNDYQYM